MANPDDKGQAELPADTQGEVKIRIDGQYLAQALRACGGMAELKLTNAYSPMLFTVDGYQLVVMPLMSNYASEQAKKDGEAKVEAKPTEPEAEVETEPVAEQAKAETTEKPKGKRSRAKEPVTAK